MTEERFWLLASLKLSGEASAAELSELESYLHDFPQAAVRLGRMKSFWQQRHSPNTAYTDAAFNKHMQRLSNHFSEPVLQYETSENNGAIADRKKGSIYKKLAWVIAAAACILLVWFLGLRPTIPEHTEISKAQNTIMTKRGNKSKIDLPDGTQVWLNADSRITYNENFLGKIREVSLSGEAFFDVVKDPLRPFVIHTDIVDIKVLGTAFNVRSYADEKITETSLIRGSVEVTLRSNQMKYMLAPNDKLVIDKSEYVGVSATPHKKDQPAEIAKLVKVKFEAKESSASETLWTRGKLAFDQESLEEIALMLERWYDVKVQVDQRIKKNQYTGVFEDEGLEQVLRALKLSDHGFYYSIDKKEVTIRPR